MLKGDFCSSPSLRLYKAFTHFDIFDLAISELCEATYRSHQKPIITKSYRHKSLITHQ